MALHATRVHRRRALVQLDAFSAAISGNVSSAWFEAAADTPEEAADQERLWQARKNIAEMK